MQNKLALIGKLFIKKKTLLVAFTSITSFSSLSAVVACSSKDHNFLLSQLNSSNYTEQSQANNYLSILNNLRFNSEVINTRENFKWFSKISDREIISNSFIFNTNNRQRAIQILNKLRGDTSGKTSEITKYLINDISEDIFTLSNSKGYSFDSLKINGLSGNFSHRHINLVLNFNNNVNPNLPKEEIFLKIYLSNLLPGESEEVTNLGNNLDKIEQAKVKRLIKSLEDMTQNFVNNNRSGVDGLRETIALLIAKAKKSASNLFAYQSIIEELRVLVHEHERQAIFETQSAYDLLLSLRMWRYDVDQYHNVITFYIGGDLLLKHDSWHELNKAINGGNWDIWGTFVKSDLTIVEKVVQPDFDKLLFNQGRHQGKWSTVNEVWGYGSRVRKISTTLSDFVNQFEEFLKTHK